MHPETKQLSLDAHLGDDGIIYLKAVGKITNQHLEQFSHWTDSVKALISSRAAAGVDPILVLADIGGVVHYERKQVTILRELLDHDKQFPVRTAMVGASKYAGMLLEALIAILMRKNIRQFRTQSEAMLWLTAGEKTKQRTDNLTIHEHTDY